MKIIKIYTNCLAFNWDNKDAHHVKTYEVALKDRDFVEGPWSQNNLDNGAGLLIPVPLHLCGVLIIGEETIVYYSASAFKVIAIRPELPWLLSCSWGLCHSLTYLAPIQKFWKLRGPFVTGSQPINALAFVLDGLYYGASDFVYIYSVLNGAGRLELSFRGSYLLLPPYLVLLLCVLQQESGGVIVFYISRGFVK
ncbi:hypothetical protein ACSBR1_040489 [Camellia fascicularis]